MKATVFAAAAALAVSAAAQETSAAWAASPDQVAGAHGLNAPYMPGTPRASATEQAEGAAAAGSTTTADRRRPVRPALFAAARNQEAGRPGVQRFRR
jgi:hypothetical protein